MRVPANHTCGTDACKGCNPNIPDFKGAMHWFPVDAVLDSRPRPGAAPEVKR
jgi:hypothetical protein